MSHTRFSDTDLTATAKHLRDSQWSFGYDERVRAANMIDDLRHYKDELIKISAALGEPNDPFAAWERLNNRP